MSGDADETMAVTVEWKVDSLTRTQDGNGLEPSPVTRFSISEPGSMNACVSAVEEAKRGTNEILTGMVETKKWPDDLPLSILPQCQHGFPHTERECQYSPSHWSATGLHPSQVIERYLNKLSSQSRADLISKIGGQLDVAYGTGVDTKIDFYGSDSLPKQSPVFAFIHGGYWHGGSRKRTTTMVRPMYDRGVVSAIIGYDLAPMVSLSTIVEQIVAAVHFMIKWTSERGSSGLYICGHSAGAQLLSMAMLDESLDREKLKGVCLLGGIYDLVPLIGTYIDRPLGLTMETAHRLSPVHCIRKLSEGSPRLLSNVNIYVVIAENESAIFHEQSRQFGQLLYENGLIPESKVHVVPAVDHFSMIECLDDPQADMVKLLWSWMGISSG